MYCKVCGKSSGEHEYCSEECKIKDMEEDEVLQGVKHKDSLDRKLAYCKRMGITYAEYQTQKLLRRSK